MKQKLFEDASIQQYLLPVVEAEKKESQVLTLTRNTTVVDFKAENNAFKVSATRYSHTSTRQKQETIISLQVFLRFHHSVAFPLRLLLLLVSMR